MPKKTNPLEGQASKEERIDDLEAASEESEEQSEDNEAIEDAEANQKESSTE